MYGSGNWICLLKGGVGIITVLFSVTLQESYEAFA